MSSFVMTRIRLRLRKIEDLRQAIEDEKVAYKNCMMRRKSAVKCNVHKKDIQWARSEIEELKDQVQVLYTKIND